MTGFCLRIKPDLRIDIYRLSVIIISKHIFQIRRGRGMRYRVLHVCRLLLVLFYLRKSMLLPHYKQEQEFHLVE